MNINEYIESVAHRMVIDKLSLIFDKIGQKKYCYLSMSPHLRYSVVAANKSVNWDWWRISGNPGITLEDILSHPDDPWKWTGYHWLGDCVSRNPGIRFQDVLQHLDMPWNWNDLSENETVTMDIVMKHLDRPWDWLRLSKNISIRWSDIQAHPDLPWDYDMLSQRPISEDQIIMDNFDRWDWYFLSRYASFDLIQKYPNWPWRWCGVCRNSNVSVAFILLREEYQDYFNLSYNHNISIQYVLAQPDAKWSWAGLSETIHFQDIINHPELPWDYYNMSRNRGLRLDFVMKHIGETWGLVYLAQNSFTDDFTEYYILLARQHLAALKIQLYWRKYATDHRYLICHRVQLCRMNEI